MTEGGHEGAAGTRRDVPRPQSEQQRRPPAAVEHGAGNAGEYGGVVGGGWSVPPPRYTLRNAPYPCAARVLPGTPRRHAAHCVRRYRSRPARAGEN